MTIDEKVKYLCSRYSHLSHITTSPLFSLFSLSFFSASLSPRVSLCVSVSSLESVFLRREFVEKGGQSVGVRRTGSQSLKESGGEGESGESHSRETVLLRPLSLALWKYIKVWRKNFFYGNISGDKQESGEATGERDVAELLTLLSLALIENT